MAVRLQDREWLVALYVQGRTGSSNRTWLSRQTGPISSGETSKSGDPAACTNI